MNLILKAFDSVLELLYPRLCFACEDRLKEHENALCLTCTVNLPQTHFHTEAENPMAQKFWGRAKIENATALYYFTTKSKVQNLMHNLKYKEQKELGELLGKMLGERLQENSDYLNADLVIPVPLHKRKLRKRGYNQSDLLAKGLADSLKIPWSDKVLKRITDTATQTKKSRWARWRNVESVFVVAQSDNIAQLGNLQNKHILLIDDVMTTGATLEACAEKLLEVEGVKVSIATIAWAIN